MAPRVALLALAAVLVACDGPKPPKTGSVAEAADRTVVSLGTATPGGGFPVYGENVPLLERRELDLDGVIPSVGSWSFIVARPSLAEDVPPGGRRSLREAELLQ